jgi:hypothetical protein
VERGVGASRVGEAERPSHDLSRIDSRRGLRRGVEPAGGEVEVEADRVVDDDVTLWVCDV